MPRLKITWEGNETGLGIPIPVGDGILVTAEVLDDQGAPYPHRLVVKHDDSRLIKVRVVPCETGSQRIVYVRGWFWTLPQLTLRATPVEGGAEIRETRKLVPARMFWLQWVAASAVIAFAVYGSILLSGFLLAKKLQDDASLLGPIALFAASLFTTGAVVWKRGRVWVTGWLLHPAWAGGLTALVVVLGVSAHACAKVIANGSVEDVTTTSDDVIKPADFGIAFGWKQAKGQCVSGANSNGGTDPDCLPFEEPSTLLFRVARWLGTPVNVGCTKLPILMNEEGYWKEQKRCVPGGAHLPDLEHVAVSDAFDASSKTGDELTLHFGPSTDGGSFDYLDIGKFRVLDFGDAGTSDGGAGSDQDLKLQMSGRGKVHELTASLGSSLVMTPAEADDGGAKEVLPAKLLSSTLPIGQLMMTLDKRTRCDMATTEQRLSALVLRRKDDVYRFAVDAPDFVHRFPVCWPEDGDGDPNSRPEYGELRLDAAWTPLASWKLELAQREIPKTLAILDSNGKSLGELQCGLPAPSDEADATPCAGAPARPSDEADASVPRDETGPLSIGPVHVGEPASAFAEARRVVGQAEWHAASDRGADPWIWMCWRSEPPGHVYTRDRACAEYDHNNHSYQIVHALRACSYYQNGALAPAATCTGLPDSIARKWYEDFGPVDCLLGKENRKLCEDPLPAAAAPVADAGKDTQ